MNQNLVSSLKLLGQVKLLLSFVWTSAGVAVLLALHLLKIESAMQPLLNCIFTGIRIHLIIYNAKI